MIINHFTDNDLYKFTTMNAIRKKFPDAEVSYRFVNRGGTQFPAGFADAVRKEVEGMELLALTAEELAFMQKKCYYFDAVYFDLLKGFRFDPDEVRVTQKGGELEIEIRGMWYRTVLWEVPLMAIVSELYYRMAGRQAVAVTEIALQKADAFREAGVELSEFGTRRRFSFDVQEKVVEVLKRRMGKLLNGTSNIYLAMKYGLTPMGTHPHEWFMYHGAHYGYRSANAQAMENWVDVYGGYLGIALSDTYTTDDFFDNFSTLYAKLFDGLRWDSGDPFRFTEKALEHYRKHRIDPRSKTIVYSDGLDLEEIKRIKTFADGRIHDVYGVGTYLTNDVGATPLNIVIKLFEAKPAGSPCFVPTVKLSDAEGKEIGFPDEIELCKKVLRLKSV